MKKLALILIALTVCLSYADVTQYLSIVARKKVSSGFDKTGLIAWYDISETDTGTITTITDQHSGGYDLTTVSSPVGGATKGTHPSGLAAETVDLASGDYSGSSNAAFDITSGGLSWGGWVYMDTVANFDGFFGKALEFNNNRSWTLGTLSGQKPSVQVSSSGSSYEVSISSSTAMTSAWTFVVGTWDPSTEVILYINGVNDTSTTTSVPATLYDGAVDFQVGTTMDGANNMDGAIMGCFVFNRVLSAAEVSTLYASGNGLKYSDL